MLADAYKYVFKEVIFCIKSMGTTFKNKLAYLKNNQSVIKQIKNKVKKKKALEYRQIHMDKWSRMQHRETKRSYERRFIHIEDIIKKHPIYI